ncbi:MAG: glycosyl transferase family 1, partial [Chloroflexi bacterium]
MRVLMLSKALVTGVYQKKAEELAKLPGVELLVVTPPYWTEARVGRLELERRFTTGYELVVEPMRFNGRHHLHWYPGLGKQMRRFRPDLVHIDEEPYNWVTMHALLQAERVGARAIFFAYQNIYRRYPPPFSLFEQRIYARAAGGLAGNQDALDVLRRKGFRGRGEVIPQFGVDPDIYRPLRPPAQQPEPIVAYYGRLVPEKGVDTIIDALAQLPPPSRAVIVGAGSERTALQER